jgi:ribose transport system substrate-binding protein
LNSVDQIGRLGLDLAIEMLDGKEAEKDTVVESPQITKKNAQEYIQKDTF